MAAINSEQQEFALHSLNDENKNKTFVFVKLTDSALKSIEDYMSLNPSQRQGIAKPTIQFQNDSNQGAITLPLSNQNSSKNEQRYSFNLSNVDADGPQGSFEFLRQRNANNYNKEQHIESLGPMMIKMQIHATEDIYHQTKVKMANAELDAKRHSTKVIKETGPNVGRKIKKTIVGSLGVGQTTNTLNSTGEQQSAYSNYKDLLNVNSTFEASSPKSVNHHSSKFNNGLTNGNNKTLNGYKDDCSLNSINHITSIKDSSQSNNSNGNSNSLSSSQSTANNQLKCSTTNPELLRKPIRDRVIHLLALRPFKKPELLAKLNRDGLREKDKKGLSALLNQVSTLKDNAYHLHRGAWHEVQVDDWPFYSTEERELVRKRNPLINNSNNGIFSATANSSSTNANNNLISSNSISAIKDSISPLATFDNQQSPAMHQSPSSNKRSIDCTPSSQLNGNLDYDYATANKKQRISHHKANNEAIKKRSPPLSNSIINTSSSLINNTTATSCLLNTAGRSVTSNSTFNNSNKKLTSNSLQTTNKYDDVINIWENKPKTPDEQTNNGNLINQQQQQLTNGHYNNSHSSPELNSSVNSTSSLISMNNKLDNNSNRTTVKLKSGLNSLRNGSANSINSTAVDRYHMNNPHLNNNISTSSFNLHNGNNLTSKESHYHHSNQFHHPNNATSSSHFNSFTNHHYNSSNQQQHNSSLCSTPNSSPDSGTGSNDGSSVSISSSRSSNCSEQQQDYLSKYTEINSIEQFRKYKSDFNCEYEEYKKLHHIVDRNANKFAQLEQELRQAQEGTDLWNTIMDRILREYEAIKRDNTYLNARNRMQYLHKKLSHIKSLILNYNQNQFRKHTVSNRSSTSSNCGNSSSIKFNSLNSANNSRIRSKHHTSVPQQSNRSKMITSS